MTKKIKFIISILSFLVMILAVKLVLAADFGVAEVNNGLAGSLSSTDPRIIVGRIIQIALSFLGVIAIVIIMYAGFLWTTSEGNEETIDKAKRILKNALIGLIIVLSSWGIATFVISQLLNATGGNTGIATFPGNNTSLSVAGAGAIGSCTVASVYPSVGQTDVPRNTSIMLTFKEEVKLDSICANASGATCACNKTDCAKIDPTAIRLYKTDLGDACSGDTCSSPNSNTADVLVTVASGNKTLVLTPLNSLGSSDGNTPYTIKFTSRIKKLDGSSMFKNCNSDFLSWDFTVSNKLDLTPPIVALGGVFPLPDNEKDIYREVTPAVAATGAITVNSCPKVYAAAKIDSIIPAGATVILNYHGSISKFAVAVPADAAGKAQLFDGNNNLLGLADFSATGQAIFKNYLTLTAASHPAGQLWEINITPEQLADTLTVNDTTYSFVTSSEINNITVPAICTSNAQAANIQAKLSGQPDIEVGLNNKVISLTAKVAGADGNNIAVTTTNGSALAIKALSGGVDLAELNLAKDKKDRPMNSALQINFAEAINPITISGSASEVANYIKVVNANASSSLAEVACSRDSDCRSYKCESNKCVGDYLGGKFTVSNGYKTVEFISDKECGMNGCGEKIYCLPANSHLAIELMAADLKTCSTNGDCSAFAPFNTCSSTVFSYKTCQNAEGKNYPAANLNNLNGIVDAAINSFDGARNGFADGPLDFYNENYSVTSPVNLNKQDKYKWSFYINDQIMLTPPQITAVNPAQGQSGITLAAPIQIYFNTLMLNSTLDTGSVFINNGTSTTEHKLINLRGSSPIALGYWISSDNQDTPPLDGEPDLTVVNVFHSAFPESVTFKAQVGSGVKDIYQNCYKPSIGPSCAATAAKPSCCFGTPTDTLGTDGNCQ